MTKISEKKNTKLHTCTLVQHIRYKFDIGSNQIKASSSDERALAPPCMFGGLAAVVLLLEVGWHTSEFFMTIALSMYE